MIIYMSLVSSILFVWCILIWRCIRYCHRIQSINIIIYISKLVRPVPSCAICSVVLEYLSTSKWPSFLGKYTQHQHHPLLNQEETLAAARCRVWKWGYPLKWSKMTMSCKFRGKNHDSHVNQIWFRNRYFPQ